MYIYTRSWKIEWLYFANRNLYNNTFIEYLLKIHLYNNIYYIYYIYDRHIRPLYIHTKVHILPSDCHMNMHLRIVQIMHLQIPQCLNINI